MGLFFATDLALGSFEATKAIEHGKVSIKAGSGLHLPGDQRHITIDKSYKNFRHVQFYTRPPVPANSFEVKE